MDPDAVLAELARRVEASVAGRGLTVRVETRKGVGAPPFETPADAAIVRAVEELTGAVAGAVAFATEGPHYSRMGIETVILGPGSIDVAHQPNEFLPLDSIEPTVELLGGLVRRFCMGSR
jgi:acetylornithine deacetylase